MKQYFKRHIALTSEHGSWVFLFSPLLIGIFAGENFSSISLYLIFAALAGFLIRQPIIIAVKAYAGRRPRSDLPAARFWIVVYAAIGLLTVVGLVVRGFGYVLWLAVPGVPVFIWHLFLISRRAERRQIGVEVVASGVLALSAPGAYWVGVGAANSLGWWLWALVWLQSAASIVYAYLRLDQRQWTESPPVRVRFSQGRRALLYTSFNLLGVVILSLMGILSPWLFLPYLAQWLETLWGTLNPAVGAKPTQIGFRQLAVSTIFTILFILAW